MSLSLPKRIFISSVSRELRSYRLALANHLANIPSKPEIKVQEDFQQGGATLLEKLAEYVRYCDLVIHLVGRALGFCPTPEHERTLLHSLGEPDTTPLPHYSATQWEYHLARRFGVRTLVYVASDKARPDCGLPIPQSDDEAAAQARHRDSLIPAGKDHTTFDTPLALLREVFRDLGLEPDIKISNLPFAPLGSLFKGRDEFLDNIRTTLGSVQFRGHKRAAAITSAASIASVHGMGGVGKTRAAIEFAHRFRDDYTALLFVSADSPARLEANLASLCGAAVLNLPEQSAREQEVQTAAALNWLRSHPGWLLIFDNVDSEEAAKAVDDLVSRLSPAGHVIVTSRLGNWSGEFEPLHMDVLTVEASTEFLLERTDGRRRNTPEENTLAERLAIKLGQLALALEQAGANISCERLTFAQYLERWEAADGGVLAWFDERLMKYPRSVATTWQASFDRLTPAARALLDRLSWLAPDQIPESLLAVEVPGEDSAREQGMAALANLEAYSLAQRSGDEASFTIHRLVQDVTRRRCEDADHAVLHRALGWINDAYVGAPQDVRSWGVLGPLTPHAISVATFADGRGIPEPTARLYSACGLLAMVKAQHARAEPLMRRALSIDEASYGKDHPKVAIRLSNLASLLQDTNRLAEAEPLMRRALSIDEASYGKDHPNVAIRLSNLASLLQDTNRLAEAEPLMRRALSIDEASYGKDHPNVAIRLSNLASLLQDTNRLAEAEPLMRRALSIDEASYGKDHPRVATDLNNLASLLQDTNRLAEAEPLMRRALAIDEASYGKDHPEVATDLNNLASLLKATNRLAEAEPLMRRALSIDEASYGKDHPRVATDLNNLASLLQATNRLAEAEPLMRRALAIDEASYGKDHPNVAIRLSNLASLLQDTNRLAEAEPLMRRALSIDEASYGKDHPRVATDLNNLASLLKATNRLAEAEPLMRRALAIDEASYGKDHPNVATDLNNLASLLYSTNHLAEAEPLMRRALSIDEASYGKDHPEVAIRLSNLASLLYSTNRLAEAEPLMRRAVEIFLKFTAATGHQHPHVMDAATNYAGLLIQSGVSQTDADQRVIALFRAHGVSIGADQE